MVYNIDNLTYVSDDDNHANKIISITHSTVNLETNLYIIIDLDFIVIT